MTELEMQVETTLNPTEDLEKVSRALRNLFPKANLIASTIDPRASKLKATMKGLDGLENLKAMLRQAAIRDAARKLLLRSISGSTIVVNFNKQAAFAGRVSFCERYDESPLGPITLRIKSENPEAIVDWVAPRSR